MTTPFNPLDNLFQQDPVDSLFGETDDDMLAKTAKGRQMLKQRKLYARMKELEIASKASPESLVLKAEFEKSKREYEQGGAAHEFKPPKSIGEAIAAPFKTDLGRGVIAGMAKMPLDLAHVANTLNPLQSKEGRARTKASLEEKMAKVDELFDVRHGAEGTIGQIGGGLAAGIYPYGGIGEVSAAGMRKILPKAVNEAFDRLATNPSVVKRIAAKGVSNVIGGAPITAGFAIDAPQGRTAESVGTNVAADLLFGALGGIAKPKTRAPIDVPTPKGEAPPIAPERQAQLDAIKTESQKQAAMKELDKQMKKLARAEWQLANPTKDWNKDLSKEGQRKITEDYRTRKLEEVKAQMGEAGTAPSATEEPSPRKEGPDEGLGGVMGATKPPPKPRGPASMDDVMAELKAAADEIGPQRPGETSADYEDRLKHQLKLRALRGLKGRGPEEVKRDVQGTPLATPELGQPVIPEKPIDPLQQKLEELKGRMAKGEQLPPEDIAKLRAADEELLKPKDVAEWWDGLSKEERNKLPSDMGLNVLDRTRDWDTLSKKAKKKADKVSNYYEELKRLDAEAAEYKTRLEKAKQLKTSADKIAIKIYDIKPEEVVPTWREIQRLKPYLDSFDTETRFRIQYLDERMVDAFTRHGGTPEEWAKLVNEPGFDIDLGRRVKEKKLADLEQRIKQHPNLPSLKAEAEALRQQLGIKPGDTNLDQNIDPTVPLPDQDDSAYSRTLTRDKSREPGGKNFEPSGEDLSTWSDEYLVDTFSTHIRTLLGKGMVKLSQMSGAASLWDFVQKEYAELRRRGLRAYKWSGWEGKMPPKPTHNKATEKTKLLMDDEGNVLNPETNISGKIAGIGRRKKDPQSWWNSLDADQRSEILKREDIAGLQYHELGQNDRDFVDAYWQNEMQRAASRDREQNLADFEELQNVSKLDDLAGEKKEDFLTHREWFNSLDPETRAKLVGDKHKNFDYADLPVDLRQAIDRAHNEKLPSYSKSPNGFDPRSGFWKAVDAWWGSLTRAKRASIIAGINEVYGKDFAIATSDLRRMDPELLELIGVEYLHEEITGHGRGPNNEGPLGNIPGLGVHEEYNIDDVAKWWNAKDLEEQADILGYHPDTIPGEYSDFDNLPPKLQDKLDQIFAQTHQGELKLDSGGPEIYEKSAAEYAARNKLPDDLRNDFIDQLIDLRQSGLDGPAMFDELVRWADANEVSEAQLRQGMEEFLGIKPEDLLAKPEEPSAPTEPSLAPTEPVLPATPTPEPSLRVEDSSAGALGPEPTPPRMTDEEFKRIIKISPRKLDNGTLDAMIEEMHKRVSEFHIDEPSEAEILKSLQSQLDKFMYERSIRDRPPKPPFQANMPPALGGAVLGWTYGYFTSDDENKASNAFMWALIGAGGAHFLARGYDKYRKSAVKPPSEMFPGEARLPQPVVRYAELPKNEPGLLTRFRRFYTGVVRSSYGLERITPQSLPAHLSAGKLASIYGRWVSMAERWMTNKPVMSGPDGNPVYLDALSLHDIGQNIAQGDIDNLGKLAVARTSLELSGRKTVPYDPVHAELIYQNAPEHLHRAADELRKYNLAQIDLLVDAGIISPTTRAKFASELWYTPLLRVLYADKGELEQLAKGHKSVVSPNPVKGRKGGSVLKVKNPYEVTVELTPKYLKAAEYQKIKQQFVAWVRALPDDARGMLMRRIENKKNPNNYQIETMTRAIKNEIPEISTAEAEQIAASFNFEEMNSANPIMTFYEDGQLRSYRVDKEVFESLKAMMPSEVNMAARLIGLPTRYASAGIVHHPWFVASMAFIDTFQAALQSRYKFRPGMDSIRGWWHIVSRSKEYQQLLDLGGPATIQSLQYSNPESAIKNIPAQGPNALAVAWKQIKEVSPFEAYKTLLLPFAEAARVGEALRALDHGQSVMEAVHAAWHVTGNTRMQGSWPAIRAWNMLALFSRPAISALDEAFMHTGLHPFRKPDEGRIAGGMKFMLKGFAYIGLPTLYLWNKNRDDEELRQLRQTDVGSRYWFDRLPDGKIIRVRKPHVLGQLFGTTIENTLDQMYHGDPMTIGTWLDGLANDAALNVVPQVGVVPYSLWSNKQIGLGTPIVPESQDQLNPTLQGFNNASNPARIVADALEPVSEPLQPGSALRRAMSPAGLDFIIGNVAGMAGQDALRLIDAGISYREKNLIPSAEEMPIVSRAFARYPSMNTHSVREFYRVAPYVEEVATTIDRYARNDPTKLPAYIERHKGTLSLTKLYQKTRDNISSYRRAIEDARWLMLGGQLSQDDFRRVEDQFLRQIIFQTDIANRITDSIRMNNPTTTAK